MDFFPLYLYIKNFVPFHPDMFYFLPYFFDLNLLLFYVLRVEFIFSFWFVVSLEPL